MSENPRIRRYFNLPVPPYFIFTGTIFIYRYRLISTSPVPFCIHWYRFILYSPVPLFIHRYRFILYSPVPLFIHRYSFILSSPVPSIYSPVQFYSILTGTIFYIHRYHFLFTGTLTFIHPDPVVFCLPVPS